MTVREERDRLVERLKLPEEELNSLFHVEAQLTELRRRWGVGVVDDGAGGGGGGGGDEGWWGWWVVGVVGVVEETRVKVLVTNE